MSRNPIERALGVWSTANYRDVMLPGLGAVTCGQFCDAMADESLSRTGAVKVKRLIAELEQMTESDRTHLREVASDEIKAILSALEPAAPEGRQEAVRIGDAVLDWMVKFDLLDAGNEYYTSDVLAVLNDLAPSTRSSEQAVTEAMVEAASNAFFAEDDTGEPAYDMRAALKAAMEAGR